MMFIDATALNMSEPKRGHVRGCLSTAHLWCLFLSAAYVELVIRRARWLAFSRMITPRESYEETYQCTAEKPCVRPERGRSEAATNGTQSPSGGAGALAPINLGLPDAAPHRSSVYNGDCRRKVGKDATLSLNVRTNMHTISPEVSSEESIWPLRRVRLGRRLFDTRRIAAETNRSLSNRQRKRHLYRLGSATCTV